MTMIVETGVEIANKLIEDFTLNRKCLAKKP